MGQRIFSWNVPVNRNYDSFVRSVRQNVARRVASRTLGPDGRPLRREIELTQGNQSLVETHIAIVTRGMQVAQIRACFHTSVSGRVERITFSPPRIVPVAPRTITGSPPRRQRTPTPSPTPSTPPLGQPPSRGEGAEGEVAGVPGILSRGRMFYGIHTTRHDTMCYGAYDNVSDDCQGVETRNNMVNHLHFYSGQREYEYLMTRLGLEIVLTVAYQQRLKDFMRRANAGRGSGARVADAVYRQGAKDMHRRLRRRFPSIPPVG